MVTSDTDATDLDIPLLAKLIYEMYPYDALEFEINAIQKTLEFLTHLFVNTDPFGRERMIQILKLQTITKFCQYAENLPPLRSPSKQPSMMKVKKWLVSLIN